MMPVKIKLPETLQEKVNTFREDSMGATKVAVVLRNGQVIEDVIIAWGEEIVKVGGKDKIPFAETDIVDVISRA